MQTILGANGQIAGELARELSLSYTTDIRLVSRNPRKINEGDELFAANLLDAEATNAAFSGSEIVYLTVGLPMDSRLWAEQFPVMMQNVIEASQKHGCKLVFFDNTYMYAKYTKEQTEDSPFVFEGAKSTVRAKIATMLLDEICGGNIEAVICRAPEFYGPGKTQSITNALIFDSIRKRKTPKVPLRDDTVRTLIWTPDASRAMALIGNSPNAYGQTWHLPCDDKRLTYEELIDHASKIYQRDLSYSIIKPWMFRLGGLFSKQVKELQELLPRYEIDNIFISNKFKERFPDFKVTTYQEGMSFIRDERT